MGNRDYHVPVLLKESVEGMVLDPDGVYIDATFGGGSHSQEILKNLSSKGSLYAFDQDEDALSNAFEDPRLTLLHANFSYVKNFMQYYGEEKLSGVLMDLGVSSYQFDAQDRGFAYRFNGDLDMRMSSGNEITARSVLSSCSEGELIRIFSEYGEVRNSKSLARKLVQLRESSGEIKTAFELNKILESMRIGDLNRYLAQVYQALRIEVNQEMEVLKLFLTDVIPFLAKGARVSIISYHSLEDRLVKKYFKTGNIDGVLQKDNYGVISRPFKIITKKPIEPNSEEQKMNTRSRSAKLRLAEKI